MEKIVKIDKNNIDKEHICCAIADKKCAVGYQMKKDWLKRRFDAGYTMLRIDARAKVFLEYAPAERSWNPIIAPNYFVINCFWVSGQYKGRGYAKELLRLAMEDAKQQGKSGLATAVGTKKYHFMSDTKWLLKQGFEECDNNPDGFSLLVLKLDADAPNPRFAENAKKGRIDHREGITVYYSDRCPFTEYHINNSLMESVSKRNLPLEIIKFNNADEAQNSPTPATIFSLYRNGKFVTTDLSACMDSRFDKIVK